MAYKCIEAKRNYVLKTVQRTYILDSEEDVATLPVCCAGSMAIVANGGKVYMVNASGEWAIFAGAEG